MFCPEAGIWSYIVNWACSCSPLGTETVSPSLRGNKRYSLTQKGSWTESTKGNCYTMIEQKYMQSRRLMEKAKFFLKYLSQNTYNEHSLSQWLVRTVTFRLEFETGTNRKLNYPNSIMHIKWIIWRIEIYYIYIPWWLAGM